MEAAYFAGYFDGEGCVTCAKSRKRNYVVRVKSCDLEVLKSFWTTFGGSFHKDEKVKRQGYLWIISGAKGHAFLKTILPFAVAKKRVIELALQCPFGAKGKRVSPSDLKTRQELWEEIHAINQREE